MRACPFGGTQARMAMLRQGTPDGPRSVLKHMGVGHSGLEVFVAEELLDSTDVCSVLQEMGGEGAAECMARRMFRDLRSGHGQPNGPLKDGRITVVTTLLPSGAVSPPPALRKDPLPAQVGGGAHSRAGCESGVATSGPTVAANAPAISTGRRSMWGMGGSMVGWVRWVRGCVLSKRRSYRSMPGSYPLSLRGRPCPVRP